MEATKKKWKSNMLLAAIWILHSFFWIGSLSCNTSNSLEDIGYNLSKPTESIEMSDSLREISGITLLDSSTVACIQDENGVVFIYDFLRKEIKTKLKFYDDGDYEGICKVDTSIFILRSDGELFEISNYLSTKRTTVRYATAMASSNNEGLCYDKVQNRLLIARKNRLAKGKEYKNKRAVYAFDLRTKTLNLKPLMEFDVDTVRKIALEEKIKLPVKIKKKNKHKAPEPILRFASSAISIHPITGNIFLLSSLDHLLFVINKMGSIEQVVSLDPSVFIQPEGIAFLENGDMLITNEGKKGNSTLLRFNYKKK